MTEREIQLIKAGRERARTDLMWLARHILGMKKLVSGVHGPMTEFLVKFDKVQGEDKWVPGKGFEYVPRDSDPVSVFDVTAPDELHRLILAPRSWFKTSLNIIAHSVQWILNFPDITILLTHASSETAEEMLGSIKRAFHSNKKMRYYFPEFCAPMDKDGKVVKEFGKQGSFNIPARKNWTTAPTCSVAGIESIRTGMHYHILKFTDVVDEKNTRTPELMKSVQYSFGMAQNLLISTRYWVDVEGTRYNFSDLYGNIIDDWITRAKKGVPQKYRIFLMPCFKRDLGKLGKDVEEFTPDELEAPYIKNAKTGLYTSRFPEEFSDADLEAKRLDPIEGGYLFACQQENNPIAGDVSSLDYSKLRWKDSADIQKIPGTHAIMSVDFGETLGKRSDPSVITTALVDRFNRKYVIDIQRGKWTSDETLDRMFNTARRFRPISVKLEKSNYQRGLQNSIDRRMQMTGEYLPFDFLPREPQQSKTERILFTLQSPVKEGLLYISNDIDLETREALKQEFTRFPRYVHDDILDTLSDLYQNESPSGPIRERQSMTELLRYAERMMIERSEEYHHIYNTTPELETSLGTL